MLEVYTYVRLPGIVHMYIPILQHLVVAGHVQEMAALCGVHGRPRRVEILHADGAVVTRGLLPAEMALSHRQTEAVATLVAVKEVLPSSDPTEAAGLAVELLLVLVSIEMADRAAVAAKADPALTAAVSNRLSLVAFSALKLRDLVAINRVGNLLLVMAQPARVHLPTAGRHEGASSGVVGTELPVVLRRRLCGLLAQCFRSLAHPAARLLFSRLCSQAGLAGY
jgi:hypothetical protein